VSVVSNLVVNVDSRNAVGKLKQVQQGAQATSQAVDKLNATTAATSNKFKIAANGIKYFTDAAGRARAENGRFLTSTERAAAGIEAQGRAAQQASGKFNGLRNALASLGAGLAVRKAFVDASELESAQARIGLLTKNFSQLTGIQEVAANAAKKFNLSQAESLGTLTDLGNRIGPTGASLQDVANVYEGFNTLLALNKVNTQNAASATLQLNQALGSGRLAGEEFNAISEATPQLLDAVAAVMGRNRSELKQLASDGKISSQVLIEALTRIRTEGAEDLETAFAGAFGATRRFNAALEDFSATIGTELLPALTPLISGATEILRLFGRLPGPVRTLIAAVAGLTAAFVVLAPAISTAIGLLGGLSIATLAAAGPWIALAAGVTAAAVALAGYRSESQKVGGAARGGGAAEVTAASKLLAQKDAQIAGLQSQRQTASGRQRGSIDRNLAVLRRERGQLQSDVKAGTAATPAATAATAMGTPVGGGGGGSGRAAEGGGASKAADEAKRLAEQIRQQTKAAESLKIQQQGSLAILRSSNDFEKAFVEFSVKRTEIQRRYSELTLASKSDEERKLLTEARALEFKQSSFELQKQIADLTKQATAPLDDIVSKLKDQVAFEREYGELIKNGTNPELAKQIIEINRAYEASAAALVPALAAAQAAVTRAEAEGASATEIQKYREELERIQEIQSGLPAKKTDAIGAATELAKPKTDQQNITEKIATLKDEIADLTSISNIAITSAEGIGNAFAQSFQGLIDGSMTAKEALGSFFKSVADMFLEMAAQIIAKQITMIILQTILKALGAVGGIQSAGSSAGSAAFGGSGPTFNPGAFSMPKLAANGATFANGIAKFASGGIVSSPTLFKFADGGTTRTGLMGEAGPEAIMPLKRGADGSLGVQANGLREAMDRQQGGGGGSPVLNMSFQSTSINGVEYVSREQLESAMAETRRASTRDGAKRGMTMTLDRIQNSSSTRRKVGI
jgi:lambda family phage tail tape measure protein